jgi:hypothetical protein
MVHAASSTPHAKYDTACKILHRKYNRQIIQTSGSLLREYLSITYMILKCPTPPLKKYINLKGLLNKFCACGIFVNKIAEFYFEIAVFFGWSSGVGLSRPGNTMSLAYYSRML